MNKGYIIMLVAGQPSFLNKNSNGRTLYTIFTLLQPFNNNVNLPICRSVMSHVSLSSTKLLSFEVYTACYGALCDWKSTIVYKQMSCAVPQWSYDGQFRNNEFLIIVSEECRDATKLYI